MKETELKYYYPYTIEKVYSLKNGLQNIDVFYDQLLGRNEYFYKDEGNYGYERNTSRFSEKEYAKNTYIISVFNAWMNWFKGGRNIFAFSEDLLKMLENTEVNDITYESFNLPYDNFYISLRPLGLKVSPESDKVIEGVFVSVERQSMQLAIEEDPNLPYDYAIGFHFVGDFEDFKLKYYDKIWDDYGAGGVIFWDYAFFFIKKENVITIQNAIDEAKEVFRYINFSEDAKDVTDTELEVFTSHKNFIQTTSKILVNCLLYLSLPRKSQDIISEYPVDLPFNYNKKIRYAKTKNEVNSQEKKIKESGFSKIQFVGNSFKNSRATNPSEIGGISPHWRRGHWRNQPYGKSLEKRKLLWIRPTMVNSDFGSPEKGHIYEVKHL